MIRRRVIAVGTMLVAALTLNMQAANAYLSHVSVCQAGTIAYSAEFRSAGEARYTDTGGGQYHYGDFYYRLGSTGDGPWYNNEVQWTLSGGVLPAVTRTLSSAVIDGNSHLMSQVDVLASKLNNNIHWQFSLYGYPDGLGAFYPACNITEYF